MASIFTFCGLSQKGRQNVGHSGLAGMRDHYIRVSGCRPSYRVIGHILEYELRIKIIIVVVLDLKQNARYFSEKNPCGIVFLI